MDETISTTDVETEVTPGEVEKKDDNDQLLIQDVKRSGTSTPSNKSLPSDIRNVLFNKNKRVGNMHENVYKVRAYDTTATVSLVDRGANEGIAGAYVRVIEKLHRQVDVQGIDNHQMTNIQIVTAGGVTRTQRGEVILIMNQYAYVGKGTSIHSSPQMESYKTIVDDRAIKCGGRQLIQTLDGYVIPHSIKNALPRIKLRPYTNKEWIDLPHVMLTSEEY